MARKDKGNITLVTGLEADSVVTEAFRTIRTSLKFISTDNENKIFMVTSAIAGEGKSTVVANLAILFASEGKRVLILDGDLRRPNLHYIFNCHNRSGLSFILSGQASLEESIVHTGVSNLDMIPAGPIQPNAAELLSLIQADKFVHYFKSNYDIVFIDAPPALVVNDATMLGRIADGILLVVRLRTSKQEYLRELKNRLRNVNDKIIGIIANDKIEKL